MCLRFPLAVSEVSDAVKEFSLKATVKQLLWQTLTAKSQILIKRLSHLLA